MFQVHLYDHYDVQETCATIHVKVAGRVLYPSVAFIVQHEYTVYLVALWFTYGFTGLLPL